MLLRIVICRTWRQV